MTVVPMKRPPAPANGGSRTVAALDVGSSKICCLIGELPPSWRGGATGDEPPPLRVLGAGHQASRGVKGGVVVDLDEAERSIRLAVDQAERMAGRHIGRVNVNIAGGRPQSVASCGSARVGGAAVSTEHVRIAMSEAMSRFDPGHRTILHANPAQISLDDARGVRNPIGMFGDMLNVDLNIVTVEPGTMRNLALAVERCHLSVASYVIAPHAAARAVLVEDEMLLGAAYIDIGGATTGIAAYSGGHLIHADVVPLGGQHITADLARGLSTSIAHAERMKTLFGSALPAVSDERELISVPMLGEMGEDTVQKVPRSLLTGIIRPRIEEILEHVRDRLEQSGAGKRCGRRAVLGGGSSQLTGLRDVAHQILDRNIRIGGPRNVQGLPEAARGPAFAVAAGLLEHAIMPDPWRVTLADIAPGRGSGNYLMRVGRWIRDGF